MKLKAVGLPQEALSRVAAVWAAADDSLVGLLRAGGLDPKTAFRGADLRAWSLAGEDVRGLDFTRANLRGTGIEDAIRDETTIFDGALLGINERAKLGLPPLKSGHRTPPPGSYTMVRIPDISDAELLERTFVINDPADQVDLRNEPPPTDQWLNYEGRYDVGTPVVCSFGHRHNRGYVFRDERGRRYLIGHNCGAKHLGMERWQDFAADRAHLEDRASYLKIIRDLKETFRRNLDWIKGLATDPAVLAIDGLRNALSTDCPALVRAVQQGTNQKEGQLLVPTKERDFQAEERQRERMARKREEGSDALPSVPTIMRTVSRPIGSLHGRVLFASGLPLSTSVAHIPMIVAEFLKIERPPLKKADLIGTSRSARLQVDKITSLAQSVNEAISFFEAENLDRLCRWAGHLNLEGSTVSRRGAGEVCLSSPHSKRVRVLARPYGLSITVAFYV